MRTGFAAALFTVGTAVCLGAGAAGAASCREELQQLEERLNESSLAADGPARFAELSRAAEDAGELRDEQLCLQQVAELNAALAAEEPRPDEVAPTPSSGAPSMQRAPPKPPVLLRAEPADAEADTDPKSEPGDVQATAQRPRDRQPSG